MKEHNLNMKSESIYNLGKVYNQSPKKYFLLDSARNLVKSLGRTDKQFLEAMDAEFVYCQ